MIGKTIRHGGLHYKILEKLGEGGPSPAYWTGRRRSIILS